MISKYGPEFIPRRATPGSQAYDFFCPIEITIEAGQTVVFDTGVSLEPGDLYDDEAMNIIPRSSLGIKYGLRLKNSVALIDSDYHDTIKAALITDESYTIKRGERFMQGQIVKCGRIPNEIPPTQSRTGGFGSTGRF